MITLINEDKLEEALSAQCESISWYEVLRAFEEAGVNLDTPLYVYSMDSFNEMFTGVEPIELVDTVNHAHHYGDSRSTFSTGSQYFHENDFGNLESMDDDDLADYMSGSLEFVADALVDLVSAGKVTEGGELEGLLYDLDLVEEEE